MNNFTNRYIIFFFSIHTTIFAPNHLLTIYNFSFSSPLLRMNCVLFSSFLYVGMSERKFSFINAGKDLVIRKESPILPYSSIIAVAVGGVLLLLLIIDFICCLTLHIGMIATLCRRTKRSPSELDEETKIGRYVFKINNHNIPFTIVVVSNK